eukprot:5222176-Pyramimonas_sp.AAC.1
MGTPTPSKRKNARFPEYWESTEVSHGLKVRMVWGLSTLAVQARCYEQYHIAPLQYWQSSTSTLAARPRRMLLTHLSITDTVGQQHPSTTTYGSHQALTWDYSSDHLPVASTWDTLARDCENQRVQTSGGEMSPFVCCAPGVACHLSQLANK